jgi:hypothetical protein
MTHAYGVGKKSHLVPPRFVHSLAEKRLSGFLRSPSYDIFPGGFPAEENSHKIEVYKGVPRVL